MRRRLTRNAYRRRVIAFAAVIFASIALISTGFATWMMSSNAKSENNGNVNVGIIENANLEFTKIELYKNEEYYDATTFEYKVRETLVTTLDTDLAGFTFTFEPKLSDVSGRVHYGESEFGPESMTMKIKGVIGPVDILKNVTITFDVPAGVLEAVNHGYIVLPNVVNTPAVLTLGNGLEFVDGSTTDLQFEYEIAFEWGTAFNGMNPGLYFDQDATGVTVSADQIQKDLLYLRAYVYGYSGELDTIYANYENGTINETQFTAQIEALQADASNAAPDFTLTIIGNIK